MTKITHIGGGSFTWGPAFLRDIFTTPELRGCTVCLQDIDPGRMEQVYRLGQKMRADFSLDYHLEQTSDLEVALDGAEFIILTITTGGLEAMRPDLEIPARYGIRQSVGDTTGPGGLSRALRNIPVVAGLAAKIDELCPQALLLNYTNPLSTLTRTLAMLRSVENRTVGLCHEWHGVRGRLAALFGVPVEQVQSRLAGINHLVWLTGLNIAGRDAWDELHELAAKILSGQVDADPHESSVFVDKSKVKARLLQLYGALPVAGDRHVAEFFPHFINEWTGWGADYGLQLTDIEFRQGMEFFARALLESTLKGETPLSSFMAQRSGEAAAEIIAAVTTGGRYLGILNLPNVGQVSNLPYDVIVETYGLIDRTGAQALAFGDLPPGVQAVLERHIRNQELTVEAALTGDRLMALQVLLNDPLSSRLTVNQAESMLAELLAANKDLLPQFH
ncbi:MAG TPA: hypothetical protein VLA49_07465 [Anaerolineales bacterium]|nr:hypothetical protein [Anaerolineales bacterium]